LIQLVSLLSVKLCHHPEDFSPMDKRLKNTKTAGNTILLFLFLFLLVLIPMSAWSDDEDSEILIFCLSPAKVKEQQGVPKFQISAFSPIE